MQPAVGARQILIGTLAVFVAACSSSIQQRAIPSDANTRNVSIGTKQHHGVKRNALSYGTVLRHVVVVIMENRTVDNLFQNLQGADTQSWGLDPSGNHVKLKAVDLDTAWDPVHSHLPQGTAGGGFAVEVDNFKNDGWVNETFNNCNSPPCAGETALAYVKQAEVQNYYDLANNFTFSSEVYQTNEGPSYDAHQYLIAGQANGYSAYPHLDAAENPQGVAQCPSKSEDVATVDLTAPWPGVEKPANQIAPCQEYSTIFDLVDTAAGGGYPNINWKSYVPATNVVFWNGPMSVKHLYNLYVQEGGDSGTGNFIVDPGLSKFTADVSSGNLPPLSYVIPCPMWADHAGITGALYGPSFVSYIANTIGLNKQYWTTEPTAIIVTWDDWGGWFDHNTPYQNPNPLGNTADPNNYGYRTPMIVISPYSRAGVVDSKQKTQSAILTFIESAFNLGTLGNTDLIQYSGDNLIDGTAFNFNQSALKYTKEPLQPNAPNFGSSKLQCTNANFAG